MPFPRAVDIHKSGRPSVPNLYGIFYTFASVCYWFVLDFLGVEGEKALALALGVGFGGFMGLFDDVVDLRWRYKALLPIFAALPFAVLRPSERTAISLLLVGRVELGALFFILLVPALVTVVTNTYNQLGGLNGLEALSGLVVLLGLMAASGNTMLLAVPVVCLAALGYISFTGRAFIGNVGSFSVGLTLAVYSVLMNLKVMLLVSMAPFILNSLMILYSKLILKQSPDTLMDEEGRLYANSVRSLRTLILHKKHLTERQAVAAICLVIAATTAVSLAMTKTLF